MAGVDWGKLSATEWKQKYTTTPVPHTKLNQIGSVQWTDVEKDKNYKDEALSASADPDAAKKELETKKTLKEEILNRNAGLIETAASMQTKSFEDSLRQFIEQDVMPMVKTHLEPTQEATGEVNAATETVDTSAAPST